MSAVRPRILVSALFLVCLALGGSVFAAEGKDVLGDPLPGEAIARIGTNRPEDRIPAEFPRPFSLRGGAMSADGRLLATFGEPADPKAGRPIHLWDARTGKLLRELSGHEEPIRAIAISPDGKTLVSSSFDEGEGAGITRIWDVATGESRHVFTGGAEFVRFSGDGSTFWLVLPNRLFVYRTDTAQEVRRFLGPNITLDLTEDGRHALGVSHNRDSVLRMYDVNNNREILKLEGANGSPRIAKFSPDGRTIAAIDNGENVLVWEVATGRLLHQLMGHKGRVFSLAFSPDGRFLVSGGLDKTIRIWELATGKEIHQLTGHAGIVTVLTFAGRSSKLVSGSTDRTALLWDTSNSLVSEIEVPEFNEETLRTLWSDLAAPVPSKAYRAMGIVAAGDEAAFRFLHERMEGLLIPTKNNRIEQLVDELDHEDSMVRQRATRELRKLRQAAQPLLLKVMTETQSAEVRARLRYILNGSDNVSRFNQFDRLRMLRLIQLAEQLGTPLSRSTLELLAAECPIAPIAKEAQRVLAKLQGLP